MSAVAAAPKGLEWLYELGNRYGQNENILMRGVGQIGRNTENAVNATQNSKFYQRVSSAIGFARENPNAAAGMTWNTTKRTTGLALNGTFRGLGVVGGVVGLGATFRRRETGNIIGNNIERLGMVMRNGAILIDSVIPIPIFVDAAAVALGAAATALDSVGKLFNGRIRGALNSALSGGIDTAIMAMPNLFGIGNFATLANYMGMTMLTGRTVGQWVAKATVGEDMPQAAPVAAMPGAHAMQQQQMYAAPAGHSSWANYIQNRSGPMGPARVR